MEIVERGAALAGGAQLVPGFVGKALDIVRQVAGELDDCGTQPGLGRDARALEFRVDGRGKFVGGNLVQPHDGAGLVERAPGTEHPFHQARLRSGKDVAHVALMLHGGAQRVLHGPAVEAGDRLELVERDDDLAPRISARRAGRANTSCARREMSRSVRTAGNDTVTAPNGDASGAYRISARADRIASFSQVRARSDWVSEAASARA